MITNAAVLLSLALFSAHPDATLDAALEDAQGPTKVGKCPVSGRAGDASISLFNSGKAYNFCCKNCLKKFRDANENKLTKEEIAAKWTLLFNGKNLDGFQKPTRDGKWTVADGVLRGSGGPGVIGSKSLHDDFEFRADVRIHDTGTRRGNSGVFIRSTGLTAMRGRWPDGPEIQIDNGDKNFWTGAIWKTAKAKKVTTKDKEWLELRILANGAKIQVWVNGQLVTNHTQDGSQNGSQDGSQDGSQNGAAVKGPIALQVHHPTDVVEFKNVKVRRLAVKAKAKATEKIRK